MRWKHQRGSVSASRGAMVCRSGDSGELGQRLSCWPDLGADRQQPSGVCYHATCPRSLEDRGELFLTTLPFAVADCRFLVAVDEQGVAHVVSIDGAWMGERAACCWPCGNEAALLGHVVDALLDAGVEGEQGASLLLSSP